jgi:arylsulfatase A-like enzyme
MMMGEHARGRGRATSVWAGIIAACVTVGCSRPAAPAPPLQPTASSGANLLLVTIDTLRRDRLGAYGSTAGLTPVLDGLAGGGVRFTHAYSHVPLTLPAHASILSGRVPIRHGVHTNGSAGLPAEVPTIATMLKGEGYRTGAFVGAFVLDARFGLSRGFDEYDDRYPQGQGPTFAFSERRGADVVQAAASWIQSGPAAGPWFAWVHLFDPHAPYEAPEEYRQGTRQKAEGRMPYDAEVAYADAMIGRLLDRLRAGGLLDRTLIVVTADHGESLGDHGETTHGLFAYDATLAVPLIVKGPGVGQGVVDSTAGHADVLPTIADLLGIASPSGIDGVSLIHPANGRGPLYIEALDASFTRGWAPLHGAIADGWKFIDLPEPELYDLARDPGETRDLSASDPERLAQMQAQFEGFREHLRALAQALGPEASEAELLEGTQRLLEDLGY